MYTYAGISTRRSQMLLVYLSFSFYKMGTTYSWAWTCHPTAFGHIPDTYWHARTVGAPYAGGFP